MVQTITEGWADYVGHLYAFTKYGTNVQETELDRWATPVPLNVTDNYLGLLERVPTYFNDFIPRGLFYDLTDPDNLLLENWDRINGFTTNNIYQKLSPTMSTIQQFRNKWVGDHPNANNAALFNRYGVN